MTATQTVFDGGFADPARDGARAFRGVLDALARPGRARGVAAAGTPAPWSAALGSLILALADNETPLWIDPVTAKAGEDLAAWALFQVGAPRASQREDAVFAIGGWEALMPLEQWRAGTPDYPDSGTTLIVEVASLEGGPPLALEGPGIADRVNAAPALPAPAASALAANRARFPLGVDLFFTAGQQVMGLPRSTTIILTEGA